MSGTLTFDVETHSRRLLYILPPEKFVRLIGYAWGNGPVQITTDLGEIKEQIRRARLIVGHNIHDFDLRAIFGIRSNVPMQLADEGRVYDTWTHAVLVHPCPSEFVDRKGVPRKVTKPEQMLSWFGLDEQAYQLGVKGKTHELKELAFEFGDPDLPKKERIEDGFGKIPVDDPRYCAYLMGDVGASREVGKALLKKGPLDAYAMREQRIESRKACISSNGWRVDKRAAQARSDFLRERRDELLAGLSRGYGFPTEGDSPWATKEGKHAILDVLADNGITPSTVEWPRTDAWANRDKKIAKELERAEKLREGVRQAQAELESGTLPPRSVAARKRKIERDTTKAEEIEKNPLDRAFGLSLAGDVLLELTEGTPIKELGKALAELMGQRSLADLTLDCIYPDGFVHPEITMLQRSGRWSTTEPGITIWDDSEKHYYIPDNDDHVLLSFDLSNADARAVAAMSGDKKYAERFLPGADGHLINAWAAWGKSVVGTDKHDPTTAHYRQLAKPGGHGWGYRIGAKKLAKTWKKSVADAKHFLDNMNKAFSGVVTWQDRAYKDAVRDGYVINPWGRKMQVEKGREYTQAPALKGQSFTREIMCDALLKLPHAAVRLLKAQIHDEFIASVPKDRWEYYRDRFVAHMESVHHPKGGQRIEFPAACGPPGRNWEEACHE